GIDVRAERVTQRVHAGRFQAGMHVIRGDLAKWLLLLHVGEADTLAGNRLCKIVESSFLPFRAIKQQLLFVSSFFIVVIEQSPRPPRTALDFQVVPGLVGHTECNGLAGERVAIPIRKLKVIVAANKARAVIYAGPGSLANAVGRFPPPSTEIVHVVNFDLFYGRGLLIE